MADNILIYDINSLPDEEIGLTMEQIMHLFKQEKLVLYDGTKGNIPVVMNVEDIEVTFVDLSKQENLKKLNGYKEKIK